MRVQRPGACRGGTTRPGELLRRETFKTLLPVSRWTKARDSRPDAGGQFEVCRGRTMAGLTPGMARGAGRAGQSLTVGGWRLRRPIRAWGIGYRHARLQLLSFLTLCLAVTPALGVWRCESHEECDYAGCNDMPCSFSGPDPSCKSSTMQNICNESVASAFVNPVRNGSQLTCGRFSKKEQVDLNRCGHDARNSRCSGSSCNARGDGHVMDFRCFEGVCMRWLPDKEYSARFTPTNASTNGTHCASSSHDHATGGRCAICGKTYEQHYWHKGEMRCYDKWCPEPQCQAGTYKESRNPYYWNGTLPHGIYIDGRGGGDQRRMLTVPVWKVQSDKRCHLNGELH